MLYAHICKTIIDNDFNNDLQVCSEGDRSWKGVLTLLN